MTNYHNTERCYKCGGRLRISYDMPEIFVCDKCGWNSLNEEPQIHAVLNAMKNMEE